MISEPGALSAPSVIRARSVSDGDDSTLADATPSLTLRALTNSLRALNNHHLQIIGIHPDVDDAASDDDVHAQFLASSNQLRVFRAGIEPDFSNGFLGNLFDDLQTDLRREVKTGAIQPRCRDMENRTVSRQPLNRFGFGMNWKY